MFFANPWGLLALFALPAIAAIHFLRRRFMPQRIAGLFLWADEVRQRPSGRRWDRLPISASLILELLAALLFALLLADLRFGKPAEVEHLVLVLDATASMSAGDPAEPGKKVRDKVADAVLVEVARLSAGGRVTLLATGEPPKALYGPAAPAAPIAAVRAALDAWRPTLPDHAPDPALALGRQLVGDRGHVIFMTDRLSSQGVVGVTYRAFGLPLANVGFIAGRREADPDPKVVAGSRCFVRLRNFSLAPASVELTARTTDGDTREVARETIRLDGRAEWSRTIALPANTPAIRFTLSDDALAADNELILAPESSKKVRYRADLAPGPVQRAIGKAMGSIRDTVAAAPGEPADLVFQPATKAIDRADGRAWRVLLGPVPQPRSPRAPTTRPEITTDGPFTLDHAAAVVRDVAFEGVILGRVGASPGQPVAPVISAGDRIVLGRLTESPVPAWLLNADPDPASSTLIHSEDWVILLANLVQLRREAMPGLDDRNTRLGESVSIPLPESPAKPALTLVPPTGPSSDIPWPRGDVLILDDLASSGRWSLRADGKEIETFAVNMLDERESDLTGAASGEVAAAQAGLGRMLVTDAPGRDWLIALLIAATAAAILGNWWVVRQGTGGGVTSQARTFGPAAKRTD
ncbi:MAG: BatA domain-containing protein [Phycisphaerae bacterium]|nr:BatA domain-containing protein [Phycisphaerae bacterium]